MPRILIILSFIVLGACKSSPEPAIAEAPVEAPPAEPAGEDATDAMPEPPVIVSDADAEHRTAPSGEAQIIKFVTGHNAFLGKLEMEAGGKVPLHRDATEEYIYILEGGGVIQIDGKKFDVGPNTAIYMPANAEVTFQGNDQKLVALQVFAGPEPSAKYDAWTK